MSFIEPMKGMKDCQINNTPHGRSVYSSADDPGHNVFNGYEAWKHNGHVGVGDAIDLHCPGGTPVYAIADGKQTRLRNQGQKEEYIYLEGDGFVATYAHIKATHQTNTATFKQGDVVGHVLASIGHLHFEIWLDGKAVAGTSPKKVRENMIAKMGLLEKTPRLIVAKLSDDAESGEFVYRVIPSRWMGDHFDVNTKELAKWIGASATGLAAYLPVQAAFKSMGYKIGTDVRFNVNELNSQDPRAYAFVTKP